MYGWLWLWFVVLTQDIRCIAHPCLAVRWWHVAMTRPPWDEGLPDFFDCFLLRCRSCPGLPASSDISRCLMSAPLLLTRSLTQTILMWWNQTQINEWNQFFQLYYMDCIWHLIFTACTSKFRKTSRHLFNRFYKKLIWGTLAHNAIIPAGYADR